MPETLERWTAGGQRGLPPAYCGMARALDTSPAADAVQLDLYRRMTPADKAARVAALTETACRMALAGLRARHPDADEPELLLHLAVLRLGAPLVASAYGWGGAVPRDGA